MTTEHFGFTTSTFGGNLPGKLRAMKSVGFATTEFWPRDLFEHAEGPTSPSSSCVKPVSASRYTRRCAISRAWHQRPGRTRSGSPSS